MALMVLPSLRQVPIRILILVFVALVLILLAGGFYLYQSGQIFPQGSQSKLSFESCPVLGEDCLKFQDATEGGIKVGFGYKLAEGTKIFTLVSGTVSFGKASLFLGTKYDPPTEDTAFVQIDDPRGFLITYYFKGTTTASTLFVAPAGTQVGVTGESMRNFDGSNLVIEIKDKETGKLVLLNPKELLNNAKK